MKSHSCYFDKEAQWYAGFESECLRFTGNSEAVLDDQFDSAALLSRGFDDFAPVEKEDFYDDDEWEMERGFWNQRKSTSTGGRSAITGY